RADCRIRGTIQNEPNNHTLRPGRENILHKVHPILIIPIWEMSGTLSTRLRVENFLMLKWTSEVLDVLTKEEKKDCRHNYAESVPFEVIRGNPQPLRKRVEPVVLYTRTLPRLTQEGLIAKLKILDKSRIATFIDFKVLDSDPKELIYHITCVASNFMATWDSLEKAHKYSINGVVREYIRKSQCMKNRYGSIIMTLVYIMLSKNKTTCIPESIEGHTTNLYEEIKKIPEWEIDKYIGKQLIRNISAYREIPMTDLEDTAGMTIEEQDEELGDLIAIDENELDLDYISLLQVKVENPNIVDFISKDFDDIIERLNKLGRELSIATDAEKSDVYSVGLLWELSNGRAPFYCE
ncbi:3497_t:CDS:10, partial [Funneliformis geosporum]